MLVLSTSELPCPGTSSRELFETSDRQVEWPSCQRREYISHSILRLLTDQKERRLQEPNGGGTDGFVTVDHVSYWYLNIGTKYGHELAHGLRGHTVSWQKWAQMIRSPQSTSATPAKSTWFRYPSTTGGLDCPQTTR